MTPDDAEERTCALCGNRFRPAEATCRASCPLGRGCPIVCCPRCGYGAIDERRSVLLRAWRRLWRSRKEGRA